MKKYRVELSGEERAYLEPLEKEDRVPPHKRARAEILLLAGQGPGGPAWAGERIAQAASVSERTAEHARQQPVEQGLPAAWERKKREAPAVEPKLAGDKEARIIALACTTPPEGRARWALT